MYGQPPSMNQYPVQNYNIPPMGSLSHLMGTIANQEQQQPPADSSIPGRENMSRVPLSGPAMMPGMTNPMAQIPQQPSGHQMGPPPPQSYIPPSQPSTSHMPPQQGPPPPLQTAPSNQIPMPQVPQGHMGPPPPGPQIPPGPQVPPGPHGTPNQVVGLPPQMGPQQAVTLPGPQGPSLQQHVSSASISTQPSATIQVPGGPSSGPLPPSSQAIQIPQGPGLPTMPQPMPQPMPHPVTQGQPMQFQPGTVPTISAEPSQPPPRETKPETAELISFD